METSCPVGFSYIPENVDSMIAGPNPTSHPYARHMPNEKCLCDEQCIFNKSCSDKKTDRFNCGCSSDVFLKGDMDFAADVEMDKNASEQFIHVCSWQTIQTVSSKVPSKRNPAYATPVVSMSGEEHGAYTGNEQEMDYNRLEPSMLCETKSDDSSTVLSFELDTADVTNYSKNLVKNILWFTNKHAPHVTLLSGYMKKSA